MLEVTAMGAKLDPATSASLREQVLELQFQPAPLKLWSASPAVGFTMIVTTPLVDVAEAAFLTMMEELTVCPATAVPL